ncbi:RNAse P Rpr2/Rpp21/SNM1 subunit domain-containing protein [Xylogone sp. PMI_703]|nr:RNAse P Rpr2/Rpp21/SNM1 subunit domain-containing protein [Xylogone sp. PMI_703]
MSKSKSSKGSIPNKALHSRVSYLYQAASYLATVQDQSSKKDNNYTKTKEIEGQKLNEDVSEDQGSGPLQPASRRLVSDLRSVSLKMQMRMSPAMKHTICKNCDTLLIDGSTCTNIVENKSKGGKKPWADILVRRCNTCGLAKRFPINAPRQKRRPFRSPHIEEAKSDKPGQ